MKLWIPVQSGFESVVKKELYALGFEKAPAENGRIAVDGELEDVARLNTFLRSGERVLMEVGRFTARTFDEFFDGFYALPWERYLKKDSKILMDGRSALSALGAIKAMGGVAKKAVIRRLADKLKNGKELFPETGARTVVCFSAYKDEITVCIDTSGDGLHKRGYRSLAYSAPLKETTAAGMIALSFYNPELNEKKPFADIFCGSGTLPIEAAMLAARIAPGLNRTFDFEKWDFIPKDGIRRVREEAEDIKRRNVRPEIYGADISEEAISIAKYHAKRAGVAEYIRFEKADMRKFQSETPYGVLISNPPYGERLSDPEQVKTLYKNLGKIFRSLPNWNGYFLTSFDGFERFFGKTADRKKKLSNANLACSLYSYFSQKPEKTESNFKK